MKRVPEVRKSGKDVRYLAFVSNRAEWDKVASRGCKRKSKRN